MRLRLQAAGMRSRLVAQAHAMHEHPVTLAERSGAVAEAAKSAVILENKYPGDKPWLVQCDQVAWKHRAKGEY